LQLQARVGDRVLRPPEKNGLGSREEGFGIFGNLTEVWMDGSPRFSPRWWSKITDMLRIYQVFI